MIKCFGYGKLLKQLFIISLISFFGLLASSFVNAKYVDFGSPINQFGDNVCNIGNNLSISCSKSSYTLTSYDPGYLKTVNSLFWTDEGIGFYFKSDDQTFQGVLYTGFYICEGDFTNVSSGDSVMYGPGCNYGGNKVIIGSYENLINKLFSDTPILAGTFYPSAYGILLSLVYDDFYFSVFFGGYNNTYPENGTYILKDMGVSGQDYETLTFGNNVLSSPDPNRIIIDQNFVGGTGTSLNGDLVIDSGYSNSDMVEGYECIGFQSSLCYGGFDIDNIFNPSENFEDFTGYVAGHGATIFEIYNLYSGSFTTINSFLDTVLQRYKNGQINSFKTEPKALLMLGAQLNTSGLKPSSVATYCNLLLNENNNNSYTGTSLDDFSAQSCLKSKKIQNSLRYGSSNIGFQTTSGGIFGGDDIDFDPNTFFSNIMDSINSKLDQNLNGGMVGILPGYIVIVFLALVFIRLISH